MIVAVLAGFDALAAQEMVPAYDEYPFALGVTAMTGTPVPALSYQEWRQTRSGTPWGWDVSGGIIYNADRENAFWYEDVLAYAVAVQIMRPVYGDAFAPWLSGRLYWFGRAGHFGRIPWEVATEEVFNDDTYVPATYAAGSYIPAATLAVGIGVETILFGHFSIPVDFGYDATWQGIDSPVQEQLAVDFSARAALRYRY